MNAKDDLRDEIFSVMEPIEEHISESDKRRLWISIFRDYKIIGRRNRRIKFLFKTIAASVGVAAAIAAGVFVHDEFVSNEAQDDFGLQLVADYSPEKSGEIRLVLPGDTLKVGSNAEISYSGDLLSISSNGATYSHDITASNDIHKLSVPYGKTARLKLSDGTSLHLNAGSIIAFKAGMSGKKRTLYLNGEAYLDVARDESRPFEVITDRMSVSVLGTSFNVEAYHGEESQSVVLVSGKVKVGSDQMDGEYLMTPRQRLSLGRSGGAAVETVDPEDYVCWTNNFLRFNHSDIADVLRRLARHYNVEFTCDETVKGLSITGNMDVSVDCENALENLSIVSGITYRKDKDGAYSITMGRHEIYNN